MLFFRLLFSSTPKIFLGITFFLFVTASHIVFLGALRKKFFKSLFPFFTRENSNLGLGFIIICRAQGLIRNTTQTITTETEPYVCYLDLFQTRNLYLTSSVLCVYDTVSNFGIDTIIKKIACAVGYNKLLTQKFGLNA